MKHRTGLKFLVGIVSFGAMLAGARTAHATPIAVDHDEAIALVDPGNPADAEGDTQELNDVLALTGTGNFTIVDPTWGSGGQDYLVTVYQDLSGTATYVGGQDSLTGTSYTIDLGAGGYEYLLMKWDGKDVYYDISGLTGEITVTNDLVSNQAGVVQNLSGYKLFDSSTSVPDGGSTAALLGSALVAFGMLRRRFNK
jgi:VPDSG-CTERM motif